MEKKLNQGLEIQAKLKARKEAFEIVAKKEDDAIKDMESEITKRRQVQRNLTEEYEAEIAKMKRNVDYCDDSAIKDMAAHLEQLTTTMETMRTALNK